MIFFISDGRLGNQIFQYAFLNNKAKNGEKIICLNMAQFTEYFDYGNKNFVFLPASKLILFMSHLVLSKILHFFARLKIIGYIEQVRSDTSTLEEVSESKGLLPFVYVKTGFFQAEKFFEKSDVDFHIRDEYKKKAKLLLQELPKNEKVFIHIRRGDYLSETFQNERGINLPKQYYIDAIDKINATIEDPFFVFLSDDPGYVRDCFGEINNKFVSKENAGVDLAIMSLCRYGVVANSSFSWWGAYLSSRKKMMIFPKYWYGWKISVESHIGIQPSWAHVIDVLE